MKESDKLDRLEEKVKHHEEKISDLYNQLIEAKEPAIVEPFNEINVKLWQEYTHEINNNIHSYKKVDPFDIIEGVAKVIKTHFEDRQTNPFGFKRYTRVYELLIKTKDGDVLRTVPQEEFKEGIERAKK